MSEIQDVFDEVINRNVLFEVNDNHTRNLFIEDFSNELLRRGLVEENKFMIVCNEENNPISTIDDHQFVAELFIKPDNDNFRKMTFRVSSNDV